MTNDPHAYDDFATHIHSDENIPPGWEETETMSDNNNPSFLPFLATIAISVFLVWALNAIAPLDTLPKQLAAIFAVGIAPYALAYFIVRRAFRSI